MADAIQRPRIFISSTIHEFRDLREALKYWLEEMGFEVQLSEHNDFDREPDKGTFEACFDNIRSSAYYLLLIGASKGSMYDESNDITVTRQEYRIACDSQGSQGKPKIVAAVRKQTMMALRERETAGIDGDKESTLDDPSVTNAFIREVRKEDTAEEATNTNDGYPQANWLSEFGTFRELTDLLRATLNIRGPLQKQALLENLKHELERNLRHTMQMHDGHPFYHHFYNTGRDQISINHENYNQPIPLTFEQIKRAWMYIVPGPPRPDVFIRRAQTEAVLSGALLDYDTETDSFVTSDLQKALLRLQDELDSYTLRHQALDSDTRSREAIS